GGAAEIEDAGADAVTGKSTAARERQQIAARNHDAAGVEERRVADTRAGAGVAAGLFEGAAVAEDADVPGDVGDAAIGLHIEGGADLVDQFAGIAELQKIGVAGLDHDALIEQFAAAREVHGAKVVHRQLGIDIVEHEAVARDTDV